MNVPLSWNGSGRDSATGWPALHVLQGLCVVGMILVHSVYWTWTVHGHVLLPAASPWWHVWQVGMGLGFFPLTLPLLAGASMRLRRAAAPAARWADVPVLVGRWACLAALGYALNVLAAGWHVLWAWNALQLIAVAGGLLELLYARRAIWPVVACGVLVLLLSDPLRAWYPAASRGAVAHVLLGDPTMWHAWPVVPWVASVAGGFVLADAYLRCRTRTIFLRGCTAVGVSLVALGAGGGWLLLPFDPQHLIGPQIMHQPAVAVLALMGVVVLLAAALTAVQTRPQVAGYGLVRCFSAGILWIYVTHMILGARLRELLFSRISHADVVADPGHGWHPLILLGFPVLLLLVSWGVGYLTVRWLHDTRLVVRLKKVNTASAAPLAGGLEKELVHG